MYESAAVVTGCMEAAAGVSVREPHGIAHVTVYGFNVLRIDSHGTSCVFLVLVVVRQHLQEARAAYWSALNYDSRAAATLEIDERIARCDFLEHYK